MYLTASNNSKPPHFIHDASPFISWFSFNVPSPPALFIDATIGATAGAGVVDLLILAACNL